MGKAATIAIDEGTKHDLQWFIACTHGIKGTATKGIGDSPTTIFILISSQ
jgi:hypothetical protein